MMSEQAIPPPCRPRSGVREWVRGNAMEEQKGPAKKRSEDQEIDYLMCSQCGTPCYVFEMDGSRIVEATCLVCGNDEIGMFNVGEEVGADED